jgi:hypothetical protein
MFSKGLEGNLFIQPNILVTCKFSKGLEGNLFISPNILVTIRTDKEVPFKTLIKLTLVLHVAVGNEACSVHV